MKTYHFKTNINSANSVLAIVKHFENNPFIKSWTIDTNSNNFLLETAVEDHITENEVISLVRKAGFKIDIL